MIPQSFIQDLLNRVDIVDVVGRFVQLKKGGANFMGLCPFHNEKSPSFTVSPTKQFYHCFGCGAHGTAISFLIEYSGMGFVEAVKDLAQGVGMVVPEREDNIPLAQRQEKQAKSMALSDVMSRANDFYRAQLRSAQPAIGYLKGRGLTGEIAARFGLGYSPDEWDSLREVFPEYENEALVESGLVIDKSEEESGAGGRRKRYDRFRGRVMFPIRNTKGQVIGFGGRVMDGGEPKYLNSPETPLFQKGSELYGLFEARQAIREAGYALVTEGYMDVVALAQLGFPQAVATLGTACTPVHVQKLLRQTDQVIFSFDGDNAGRRAARRALEACLPHASDNKTIKFLFLPKEHDPDSYVREMGAPAFEEQIREALPLSQFLLREIIGENDLRTPEGRAHAQFAAKPMLQALPASSLRLQIVRSVAQATQSTPAEIEALFELEKPVARLRAAPPRAKRTAPAGLERQIMRLLVAHPQLSADLDAEALQAVASIAPDRAEMLSFLVGAAQSMGEQANFASLVEHLREAGPEFDSMIAEIASESESEFDVVRAEMAGAIRQSKIRAIEEEMQVLVASNLRTEEERNRYRELMQSKEVLKRQPGAAMAG
ncbi:DNA primase [Herbaspirillum robiniae]|uniref:DNA primase n=1 Tax=Herbaspirillum robiniae TaxID=2014887 RepID=A0A246WS97_9BURK|nr:DNA primase [Herbaspirillum robiniae]NUU00565.1 DNA primase [Herbaspirillum robiniae]OWY29305.1 DNA primase [Herbaspirillum robiniae]